MRSWGGRKKVVHVKDRAGQARRGQAGQRGFAAAAAPVNGHDGAFPARRKRLKKTKGGQIFRQMAADDPVMGMIGGPIGLAVVQAGAALRPVLLQRQGLPGRPQKAAGRLALQRERAAGKAGDWEGASAAVRTNRPAARAGSIGEVRGIQITSGRGRRRYPPAGRRTQEQGFGIPLLWSAGPLAFLPCPGPKHC